MREQVDGFCMHIIYGVNCRACKIGIGRNVGMQIRARVARRYCRSASPDYDAKEL